MHGLAAGSHDELRAPATVACTQAWIRKSGMCVRTAQALMLVMNPENCHMSTFDYNVYDSDRTCLMNPEDSSPGGQVKRKDQCH